MKKILLCCNAGMSTSMVVKKMQQAAKERGIDAEITAVSAEQFNATLPDYDCCLLGPQIKYKLEEKKKRGDELGKPVDVINPMDYGMMKGDKILDNALTLIAAQK